MLNHTHLIDYEISTMMISILNMHLLKDFPSVNIAFDTF